MDTQLIVNAAFAVVGSLAMFLLKAIYHELRALKDADKANQDKLHTLENHLASHYPKREELRQEVAAVFQKFDRFCENFGAKMDKLGEKLDQRG
jgi:hypothetical protein